MDAPPPDSATEDALIPLSALQHQLFCPRQCALIHVEGLWAEDGATAEGRVLHERVDAGKPDRRPGVRVVRAMAIRSLALGVAGKADVVELHGAPPRPYPVEYKRGGPRRTAPTKSSLPPRPSRWRRCSPSPYPRAPCITARRGDGRSSPSTRTCAR